MSQKTDAVVARLFAAAIPKFRNKRTPITEKARVK